MKTALITGIGRGIGKALADKFLKEGWHVIGTVLSSATPESDPNLESYLLDLSSPASITKCAGLIAKSKTKIDVLINNAGILADKGLVKLDIDKLRKNLEVNLIGTSEFTEKLLPTINDNGHILFITSAAGSLGDMDHIDHSHAPYKYPGYKISKTALNMYMRTLAARFHHEGKNIIASSVHPGWVRTSMGGDDAPVTPEQAAEDIYKLAVSRPETGQFWYKGNKYPW